MFKSYALLPMNLTLFGNSLGRYNQIKLKSHEIQVGSNPTTGIIRRGKFGHTHTSGMTYNHGGRDWS